MPKIGESVICIHENLKNFCKAEQGKQIEGEILLSEEIVCQKKKKSLLTEKEQEFTQSSVTLTNILTFSLAVPRET